VLFRSVVGSAPLAVIYRLLNLAKELDKSEKVIKLLEERLSKLQYPEPAKEETAKEG
jgi:hypothetical protein